MAQTKQIEYILRDIKTLDYQGKLEILEKIVHFLRHTGIKKPKRKSSLLELDGLGKNRKELTIPAYSCGGKLKETDFSREEIYDYRF